MRILPALFCAACATSPAATQIDWNPAPGIPARATSLVHDPVTKATYAFGGLTTKGPAVDLWQWTGQTWLQVASPTSPTALRETVGVWDTGRSRLVAVGHRGGNHAETWEYDGASWTRVATSGPLAESGVAMAYDPVRRRVVRFGGTTDTTWEWDGQTWRSVQPAVRPSRREQPAMAWDPVRRKLVLFGGAGRGVLLGELWEYDGTTWVQRFGIASPTARRGAGMRWDPNLRALILFGGQDATGPVGDTWSWDGRQWTQLPTTNAPTERANPALIFDTNRRRTILFGGLTDGQLHNDTWEFNGTRWLKRTTTTAAPNWAVTTMAIDPLSRRAIMFGGMRLEPFFRFRYFDCLWEWGGSGWTKRMPASRPPGRVDHVLATDYGRGRTVLFGGQGAVGKRNDTWEWDGQRWARRTLRKPPPARTNAAMAYDTRRQRLVLFGGHGSPDLLNDTWEYDGQDWIRLTPRTAPTARRGHRMAYDVARGVIVLHGGLGSQAVHNDTWEWNGIQWKRRATSPRLQRYGFGLAYDELRQRVTLVGGGLFASRFGDVFEWDGRQWNQRPTATRLPPRYGHALGFDGATQRMVLIGGGGQSDTWTLGPVVPARVLANGSGCSGSGGTPNLTIANGQLPWIDSPIGARLTQLPTAAIAATYLVGTSNRRWGSINLPLDLSGVGMPTCRLATCTDLTLARPAGNGAATLTVPIPANPWLLGRSLFVQGLVRDPGANAAGAVVSNSIELRFGGR